MLARSCYQELPPRSLAGRCLVRPSPGPAEPRSPLAGTSQAAGWAGSLGAHTLCKEYG